MRYQIAVDAMGGDHAPSSVVDGVKLALAEMNDIEIRLCGPASALDACRLAYTEQTCQPRADHPSPPADS